LTLSPAAALLRRALDPKGGQLEPLPDLATLSDDDLKQLIDEETRKENEISYQRRLLHGKIDILRAELVARLQKTGGQSVLDQVDVDHLTAILTSKAAPPG
jgi:hypothetical protein